MPNSQGASVGPPSSSQPSASASRIRLDVDVKTEPVSPSPPSQPFGTASSSEMLHGQFVPPQNGDGRFQSVAGSLLEGRFPMSHQNRSLDRRLALQPDILSNYHSATATGGAADSRSSIGPHQFASLVGSDIYQTRDGRFQPISARQAIDDQFRARLPIGGSTAGADTRFQFMPPSATAAAYLSGGRFDGVQNHLPASDCVGTRFQLNPAAATTGSSEAAVAAAALANGPLGSLYQCHRDFDNLYTMSKRPRLTSEDWLCWGTPRY